MLLSYEVVVEENKLIRPIRILKDNEVLSSFKDDRIDFSVLKPYIGELLRIIYHHTDKDVMVKFFKIKDIKYSKETGNVLYINEV